MKLQGTTGAHYRVDEQPFSGGGSSREHQGERESDGLAICGKVARDSRSCSRSLYDEARALAEVAPTRSPRPTHHAMLISPLSHLGQPARYARCPHPSPSEGASAHAVRSLMAMHTDSRARSMTTVTVSPGATPRIALRRILAARFPF